MAQACLLHGVGDAASNKLTCRTINTTLTVSKTTTETLEATYKVLQIDFSNRANVKFYSNGARLKTNQIFDWSAATGGCQPLIQIGKSSSTDVGTLTIDYLLLESIR